MYYLTLSETAESQLMGAQQQVWLARLETEHDNMRAAIQWASESPNTEMALRFGAALWHFWWKHGYLSEGRIRLEELLGLQVAGPANAAHSAVRASLLLGAGLLANDQADYRAARAYFEESQALWQALGDQRGIARSLGGWERWRSTRTITRSPAPRLDRVRPCSRRLGTSKA